jgi:hypothetical protein
MTEKNADPEGFKPILFNGWQTAKEKGRAEPR